jgi:hypothetical protein
MKQQLHKKLIEEFNLRGTPLETRKTYSYCVGRFERHFRLARSPARRRARAALPHAPGRARAPQRADTQRSRCCTLVSLRACAGPAESRR